MDLGLAGKTAVVGGSSSGLGLAVARALAADGAKVLVVSRHRDRVERAVDQVRREAAGAVEGVALDLTEPSGPARALAVAEERLGPVAVVVANGGGPPAVSAVAATDRDLEAACGQLLLPVQRFVHAALPGMRERGWGRIVAITSIAVRQPLPGLVLSNSLRAAVTGYLKSVADEVGGDGVTINTVCPGFTATERLTELAESLAAEQGVGVNDVVARWAEQAPVGRMLRPEEVAAAVAFLCSEPAGGITGVALAVDGGLDRGLL